jgi:hypothetical protein
MKESRRRKERGERAVENSYNCCRGKMMAVASAAARVTGGSHVSLSSTVLLVEIAPEAELECQLLRD